jgi:hypothetical protein
MAFTTDAQVKQDVADVLHTALANLPTWVDNVVERVHEAAYQEIVEKLTSRGFTSAQILAWTQGEMYERSIALWYFFTSPQAIGVYDKQALETWERYRSGLKSVTIAGSSGWTTPGDTPGVPAVGLVTDLRKDLSRDEDDMGCYEGW